MWHRHYSEWFQLLGTSELSRRVSVLGGSSYNKSPGQTYDYQVFGPLGL